MSRPLVSLITVNFNGRSHLGPFLDSVLAQDYPQDQVELIVVDNGSSDGSVESVQAHYPSVKVLTNEANLGFAKANNQGAESARGRYLALLNNDVRLERTWVRRMVACLENTPGDVICAGSMILNWDGSSVDFGGGTMAFNGVGFQTHAHAPVGEKLEYPDTILFACGCALMVERDVYLEAGGFDADYFAYLEDVDFGWRLWVLGFRVAFCSEAVVYHRHNATSSQFDSHRKAVLIERNALYSVFKNYDDALLAAVLPPTLLLAVKRIAVRSGIPREEFSFVPRVTPAASAPAFQLLQTDESLLSAFKRVWRDEGPAVALEKSARKGWELARRTLTHRPRRSASTAPLEPMRPIQRDAYATVVAIEDFIEHLPELVTKRQRIQAARRRADDEILGMFGTPFKAPAQAPKHRRGYESAHETTLRSLGIRDYFAERTETEEGAAPRAAVRDFHSLS
jgi:GT2 family glycosyltransferase